MFFFLLLLLIITWRGAQVFFCSGYLPIYDEFLFGMTGRNRDFRQCGGSSTKVPKSRHFANERWLIFSMRKKCASSGSKWGAWNWPKSMPRRRRLLEQNYVMHFCAKWFLLQQADIVRFSTPFEFFACNANRYLMTTSKFLTELWKFPYSIIRKIKNPFGFLILSYSYVDKWYFFFQRTKLLRPSQYYVISFQ